MSVSPEIVGQLVAEAESRYGKITPRAGRTIEECVTENFGKMGRTLLWFQSPDGSTHIVQYDSDRDYIIKLK